MVMEIRPTNTGVFGWGFWGAFEWASRCSVVASGFCLVTAEGRRWLAHPLCLAAVLGLGLRTLLGEDRFVRIVVGC